MSNQPDRASQPAATRAPRGIARSVAFVANRTAVIFAAYLVLASAGLGAPAEIVLDQTAKSPSVCELHHVQMTRERVSLFASGFAAPYDDYSRCPHGKRPIDTGCNVMRGYGFIWVCAECERACGH